MNVSAMDAVLERAAKRWQPTMDRSRSDPGADLFLMVVDDRDSVFVEQLSDGKTCGTLQEELPASFYLDEIWSNPSLRLLAADSLTNGGNTVENRDQHVERFYDLFDELFRNWFSVISIELEADATTDFEDLYSSYIRLTIGSKSHGVEYDVIFDDMSLEELFSETFLEELRTAAES